MIHVESLDRPLAAKNFITQDRKWDVPKLSNIFSIETMTKITCIPLPSGNWADQLCWGSYGYHKVSLSDMYSFLHSSATLNSSTNFS